MVLQELALIFCHSILLAGIHITRTSAYWLFALLDKDQRKHRGNHSPILFFSANKKRYGSKFNMIFDP